MIGILTEKKSAKDNFSKALGGSSGVFDGESYIIVNARGHLFQYPEDPDKMVIPSKAKYYSTWSLNNLPWEETDFRWSKQALRDKNAKNILFNLKNTLDDVDEIVIATDNDPSGEGDAIGWEIIKGLSLDKDKKISRMYFASESPKDIKKAFKNRKEVNENDPQLRKAIYRSKWDYLSMQWTRIATLNAYSQKAIRQGRLKSAMTQLVGKQIEDIKHYKENKEDLAYYEVKFKDDKGVLFSSDKSKHYKTKEDVPLEDFKPSKVRETDAVVKTKPAPKLLDLGSLGGILSNDNISSKELLRVYQDMYQDSVLSYPRTEDTKITTEQFKELLPLIDKIAKIIGVDPKLLKHRELNKRFVSDKDLAHGANRPGVNVPKSLDEIETKYGRTGVLIYENLAKNFLAIFADDYKYETRYACLEDYRDYTAYISVPLDLGWKAIYNDPDDLNETKQTEFGTKAKPFINKTYPKKPKHPTWSWLNKQLINHNIGTGATRLSTYANISDSRTHNPIFKDKKGKIYLTNLGEDSYILLKDTKIGSLDITKEIMDQMDKVATGNFNEDAGFYMQKNMIKDDMQTMQENSKNLENERKEKSRQKDKVHGLFQGKNISFNREFNGHSFTDAEIEKLLDGEIITIGPFKNKYGNEYLAKGNLAKQEYKGNSFWGFKVQEFIDPNEDKIYAKGKFNGQDVKFKRKWSTYTFNDAEIQRLLDGETVILEDVKTKKGDKTYNVKGYLAEQEYRGHKFFGFKPEEFFN